MVPLDRRTFISCLAGSLIASSAQSFAGNLPFAAALKNQHPVTSLTPDVCWLDVAAPFVTTDPALGISTNFLLTASCFPGVDGFRDPKNQTDYQIQLYDATGRDVPLDR